MMGTYTNYQITGENRQNGVTGAIRQASAKTGVDFNYLMQQAAVESGMNPTAKAKTSSATGLYQFIDQTWLRMMKAHGAEHGYGREANAIKQRPNGDLTVPDRAMRNQILNLRKDPKAASLMAAELANENHQYLQSTVGKQPSKTDLYMAHFLGAGGASNFLKSMQKNPWAPAASIFPEAARSNKGVFYAEGRPLSLQQVYNRFQSKFATAGDGPAVTQTASAAQDEPSFVKRVVLPEAETWTNPSFRSVERFASSNRMAGLRAITANLQPEPLAPANRLPGGFLSSPVAVMELASMHMDHNNNKRYNA